LESKSPAQHKPRKLTMGAYIRRRNGVSAGESGGLQTMLKRSFGATSFAGFWQYWNPIFGYALGRYIYSPLKRFFPLPLALVVTFVVCGEFHDLVTMLVRGAPAFLFLPWFLFLGVGVVISRHFRMDLSLYPWGVRAIVNSAYLAVCLVLALLTQSVF